MHDVEALIALLTEAGEAHHDAFIESDGADPEWPLWYAEYLEPRLRRLIGYTGTRSELVARLVESDRRHRADVAHQPRPPSFARTFSARLLLDGD
jgi:hypothetical protein